MRAPTNLALRRRTRAAALGVALSLTIAGCSDSTDGTPTPSSEPVPASGSSGYSVQDALASLPALDEATETVSVATGDLVAASDISGLERPTDLSGIEAILGWSASLTGVGGIGGVEDVAPVFVPIADGFSLQYLAKVQEFHDEVGWSLIDADTFAERQTAPHRFLVFSGDVSADTFPEDLPEIADGVVTAGEGEDYVPDPQDITAARPIGVPLRMASRDAQIAAAPSTPEVSAWLEDSATTLADDADLMAVAGALDDAGVVSAQLVAHKDFSIGSGPVTPSQIDALDEFLPADPFDAVGLGWNAESGTPVITVAFKFADDEAAADAVGVYEDMFAEATSLQGMAPLTEYYELQDATSDGAITTLTLGVTDAPRVATIYQALMSSDLPFVHQ